MRRVIGRQHLWTVRPWFTVVILPLLLVQILATSLQHPMTAVAVVPGTAVGIALGLLGTWLTRFEVTPAGLSCTPDTRLGIALSLLLVLVLRIGYRIVSRPSLGTTSIRPLAMASSARWPATS